MKPSPTDDLWFLSGVAGTIVALLCAIVFFILNVGCSHPLPPRPAVLPAPVAAPVIAGQTDKDTRVLVEADKIDALAPAAKPHTDAQRAAIAANPAAKVEELTKSYEATIKSYESAAAADAKRIASIEKDLADAKSYVDRLIRIGLSGVGGLFITAGILSFFLAAQVAAILPGIGPRVSIGLVAAGFGLIGSSIFYGWAVAHQTLLVLIFSVLLAGVSGLYYANHHHAKTT